MSFKNELEKAIKILNKKIFLMEMKISEIENDILDLEEEKHEIFTQLPEIKRECELYEENLRNYKEQKNV